MKKSKKVIININLAPRDPFFNTAIGKVLKWALSVGRYIVIFTELIVILSFVARFSLDRQLTDLNDSINQKQIIIQSYGELEDNFRTLQGKLENFKQIEQLTNIVDIFPKLAEVIPSQVRLDELVIKPTRVIFSGTAYSQKPLNFLINNLQISPNFHRITVEKIESESDKSQSLIFSIWADTQEKVQVKKATKKPAKTTNAK